MARPSHPPSLFPLSDLPLVFLSTISKALTIASLLRRSVAPSSKALIKSETILLVTSLELSPESLPSLSASVSSRTPEPSPSLNSVPAPLPSLLASVSSESSEHSPPLDSASALPSLPEEDVPVSPLPLDVELSFSSSPSSAEDGESSILLVASEPP